MRMIAEIRTQRPRIARLGLAASVTVRTGYQKHESRPNLTRVLVKHFVKLRVRLHLDEDALSRRDTAAAGQTVLQRDTDLGHLRSCPIVAHADI